MANISNEEFNKIRNSVNIVDVIGNYVNLEKKGKNFFGICPFHDDHTPSMSVSFEKQIYTCFVCGASGNVFTFIRDFENISFLEAVKKIADYKGITLSKTINVQKKYDKEYKAYDLALKYYKNNLNTDLGKKAKEYLLSRKINEKIIEEFDIGVSLNDNNLSKLLISKNFSEDMLLNIGLVNKNEEIYDIFRNRIMFPIHNSNGIVIGFSGRIYNNEVDSKYINTRETYIFKKGETLFNYHRAVLDAKKNKYLILCEGQMDAIRIYSSGLKNVVATMGTALTREHINLIRKLNVRVVLNMDADKAGINAALINGDLIKNAGISVSVVTLTGAKDPDEYILKYGLDAYKDAISHAISLFDFKLNYLKSNKNLNNANDLSEYINNVIDELNKSNDDILKDVTISKLSEDYNIDKNILLSKLVNTEVKKDVTVKRKVKKQNQNIRAVEEILYYMMNNVKYAKIFTKELNYIPDKNYFDLEKDIQAYIILNNTINLADFISYEINNGKEELIKNIINNHDSDIEMDESEFTNYIKIVNKWVIDSKISNLKVELKNETDINKKKELMDLITKIKRGSEEYGK
ncbi:MAG: DNA primase [Bacilli bacterium]|nr:DNA primase [Bacilli bacterium]